MQYEGGWARLTFCPAKIFGYSVLKLIIVFQGVVDIIDSESFSSEEEEEEVRPRPFEPLPLPTTPSGSCSKIPISMAMLYVDPSDPPEYMNIETPPSSPELNQSNQLYLNDQSDISRTKTSEWIKQVSIDGNQRDQLSLSKSDSAKKSRRKKFVPGGLADQLQRIIQRENSEITFWEHRLANAQQDNQQGMCTIIIHMYTHRWLQARAYQGYARV